MNPFKPSFGVDPLFFAGRSNVLEEFKLAIFEGVGSPYRTLLISGPRGSGKTVLLNRFESVAKESGWIVLRAYANRSLLKDLVKAGGVLITIDELQSAPIEQLAEVAVAVQDLMRDGYDVALVGAGLTFGVENLLEEPGTTFLRRAMRIELAPVDSDEVMKSFAATASAAGKHVSDAALDAAAQLIQGYPYLLQLVGSKAWAGSEMRQSGTIEAVDIAGARSSVVNQMGQQIHKIALRDVPDAQLDYLEAMAALAVKSGEPVETGAIAADLGKTQTQVSTIRKKLIERDLVYAPRRGFLQFRLPYLGEFLLNQL